MAYCDGAVEAFTEPHGYDASVNVVAAEGVHGDDAGEDRD